MLGRKKHSEKPNILFILIVAALVVILACLALMVASYTSTEFEEESVVIQCQGEEYVLRKWRGAIPPNSRGLVVKSQEAIIQIASSLKSPVWITTGGLFYTDTRSYLPAFHPSGQTMNIPAGEWRTAPPVYYVVHNGGASE